MRFGLFGSAQAQRGGGRTSTAQPASATTSTTCRGRGARLRQRLRRRASLHRLRPGLGEPQPADLDRRRAPRRCGSAPRCWCCPGTTRCCWPSRPRRSTCCRAAGSISASARATATTSSPASASRWRRPSERFEEALEVITKAWTSNERFSHHGKYWQFDNIVVEPPTIQKPHPPFWQGAGHPGFDPHAWRARGHNLLLDQFASIDETGERLHCLSSAEIEANGRASIRARSASRARSSSPTTRRKRRRRSSAGSPAQRRLHAISAAARRQQHRQHHGVSPTPARRARRARCTARPTRSPASSRRLRGMGVEYMLLNGGGTSRENLRRFAREVMPAFMDPAEHAGACVAPHTSLRQSDPPCGP